MGLPPVGVAKANHKSGHTVNVVKVLSPSGIEAWLVRDHLNPIINMHFAFRGGSALDPGGKEGLAYMVSGLLDEGAGDLDSQLFQRRLEDLSIVLRAGSQQRGHMLCMPLIYLSYIGQAEAQSIVFW